MDTNNNYYIEPINSNDNILAYSMLHDKTKKEEFKNINELINRKEELYNYYTSKIYAYNKEEKDRYTLYNIIDDNQNKIQIYEYHIMDYKIAF